MAHAKRWLERLEKDMFPYVGGMALSDISASVLLQSLRRVEARGVRETVHSLQQSCGQVFRYGIATGRSIHNPGADLRGALKPVLVKNMAAVTEPRAVGHLLRAIDGYQGNPLIRAALVLSALLFPATGKHKSNAMVGPPVGRRAANVDHTRGRNEEKPLRKAKWATTPSAAGHSSGRDSS